MLLASTAHAADVAAGMAKAEICAGCHGDNGISQTENMPQVAQAALAVECREDDAELRSVLAAIEHEPSRRCVDAERAFLAELGGDCSLPAAAYATLDAAGTLSIEGRLGSVDGSTILRHTGNDGAAVARHLLDHGGRELLGG